jgi:hypothetical protein
VTLEWGQTVLLLTGGDSTPMWVPLTSRLTLLPALDVSVSSQFRAERE